MAVVGKGRVVGVIAGLGRLALAIGLGCIVFAATVKLVLADDAAVSSPGYVTSLGLLGAIWTVGGLAVEWLLRMVGEPAPERTGRAPPSWHNQPVAPGARPARRPAPPPQVTGWWTVLGVPADAPPATFEGAARTLLRQSHPDRWATAEPARRQEAEGRTRAILQALAEARASSR